MLIGFRRELDDTDLLETETGISAWVCVCILVSVSKQDSGCSQNTYLTSVAVFMIGPSQALDIITVSTVFFWND